MKRIAFSATNPCHVYDMAVMLHRRGRLRDYHSGYPGWRLRPPADFPLSTYSARTVATYGLLRLPHAIRPSNATLFRWQDNGFDTAVARALKEGAGDFLHVLPGQARRTLKAARARGWRTVLNHASGPVRLQAALLAQSSAGSPRPAAPDAGYLEQVDEEYSLAEYHCVASSIVRQQLVAIGIDSARIWTVPYGADPAVFHPPARPRERRDRPHIVFAGQLTARKGLPTLLSACRAVAATRPIRLELYGPLGEDLAKDARFRRELETVSWQGAVSQSVLAHALRAADVLVLPSLEEGFGLVVPQALACGVPCIVSDRVGAADLIESRINGSVFPVGNSDALAAEIAWWLEHRDAFRLRDVSWTAPAERLIALSDTAQP